MLADEARYLAAADLYVLTPQMLDVVIAAAQSLTLADLALLRKDDLPSPSGAVVLPRLLITRHQSGSLYRNIAFTWHSPAQVPLPAGMGFGRAELPAVRLSEYTCAPRSNRSFMHEACAQRVTLPPMLLDFVWCLPLHPDTPGQAHDYDLLADALRRLNAAYWQEEARNKKAANQDHAVGEYASGAILDEDQDGTFASRFMYAFWRLCEQQIGAVQVAPGRPQRPGHRRPGRSEPRRTGCRAAPRRAIRPPRPSRATPVASPLASADAQGPAVVPEPAAAQGDLPRAFHQGRHDQAAARRGTWCEG
jgi:hypothetical protein